MRRILKASVICWGIVLAFFLFFLVPFEAISPTGAAISAAISSVICLAGLAFYIYRLRQREGFEFGWFIARKHGFWLILLGGIALLLLIASGVWFLAPGSIEQPLANGAMPAAMLLVLLFWFSIIFVFLGFAVACFAESAAYMRVKEIRSGIFAFALALFWLALGAGCCSLFLDVINDIFFPVSVIGRRWSLGTVALITMVVGLGMGGFQKLDKILPAEETGQKP